MFKYVSWTDQIILDSLRYVYAPTVTQIDCQIYICVYAWIQNVVFNCVRHCVFDVGLKDGATFTRAHSLDQHVTGVRGQHCCLSILLLSVEEDKR